MLPVDFKGKKNFCLDQEGEGVPGRGAHVRVKACVIDGRVSENSGCRWGGRRGGQAMESRE